MKVFRAGPKSAAGAVAEYSQLFLNEMTLVGVNADNAADIDRQGRRP